MAAPRRLGWSTAICGCAACGAREEVVRLALPRKLRIEPTGDDPGTVALLFGPLVLAGDLGPATLRWDGLAPVLVGDDLARSIVPTTEPGAFRTEGLVHPVDLTLRPFTFQHDNNTAVYFRRFTETEGSRNKSRSKQRERGCRNWMRTPRMWRASGRPMRSANTHWSQNLLRRRLSGRAGRDARSGGFFECAMKANPGPLTLQATYWGEERDRRFKILVDGVVMASEQLSGAGPADSRSGTIQLTKH